MLDLNYPLIRKIYTVTVSLNDDNTDFTCSDYSSDDVCIQAAIDYVNNLGGGSVLIREGTYLTKTVLSCPSNITLSGVGAKTIIKLADNTNTQIITNSDTSGGNENIYIKNIYFDGNAANQTNIVHAVGFEKVNSVTIKNVIIKDAKKDGINIKGQNCIVNNCRITDSGVNGICFDGNGILTTSQNIISNCITIFNGAGSAGTGLLLNNVTYSKIVNSFSDNWLNSIRISGTNTIDCKYNTIANCHAINATESGIKVGGISGTPDLDMQTITGNTCYANSTNGIILRDGSKNNQVSVNICNDNGAHGIYLNNSHGNITGNTSNNNTNNGISVDTHNNVNVNGNYCDGNQRGIWTKSMNHSAITNNYIKNSGIEGIYVTDNGSIGTTYLLISGNKSTNNTTNGIRLLSLSEYITVENNDVRNNTSAGISPTGSHNIYRNNVGYNPIGTVGPPSVPATTVNYTNDYGYPSQVQIYGGTVTEIDIDDIATGLTSGVFILPAGGTINITYSVVPSWRWWGL